MRTITGFHLLLGIGILAGCVDPSGPELPRSSSAAPLASLGVDQRGDITIVLMMRPETAADVPFVLAANKRFVLDDDADQTLGNTQTFQKLKAGTYVIQQLAAPDGPLVQIRCISSDTDNNTFDLPARTATIGLEANESVVCTFVDGWKFGDVFVFSQGEWAGGPAAQLLLDNYFDIYASTIGVIELGVPGAAGFSNRFSNPSAIVQYLPTTFTPGPLTADLVDPSRDASGIFGGEVTALKLNVDFSDAALLDGSGIRFGDLELCDLSALPLLNGMTVRQFFGVVNPLLGGASGPYSIDQLSPITTQINESFSPASNPFSGVSQFAQDHVFVGGCP